MEFVKVMLYVFVFMSGHSAVQMCSLIFRIPTPKSNGYKLFPPFKIIEFQKKEFMGFDTFLMINFCGTTDRFNVS